MLYYLKVTIVSIYKHKIMIPLKVLWMRQEWQRKRAKRAPQKTSFAYRPAFIKIQQVKTTFISLEAIAQKEKNKVAKLELNYFPVF